MLSYFPVYSKNRYITYSILKCLKEFNNKFVSMLLFLNIIETYSNIITKLVSSPFLYSIIIYS